MVQQGESCDYDWCDSNHSIIACSCAGFVDIVLQEEDWHRYGVLNFEFYMLFYKEPVYHNSTCRNQNTELLLLELKSLTIFSCF